MGEQAKGSKICIIYLFHLITIIISRISAWSKFIRERWVVVARWLVDGRCVAIGRYNIFVIKSLPEWFFVHVNGLPEPEIYESHFFHRVEEMLNLSKSYQSSPFLFWLVHNFIKISHQYSMWIRVGNYYWEVVSGVFPNLRIVWPMDTSAQLRLGWWWCVTRAWM